MAKCENCRKNLNCPRDSYSGRRQLASDFGCYLFISKSRTKLDILQESIDIWSSYSDQIEMEEKDQNRLTELDIEYVKLNKEKGGEENET